jgi:hypothetical protein
VTAIERRLRVVSSNGLAWIESDQTDWPASEDTAAMLTLIAALNAKDEYTRGHSDRVALYARAIARELGLGPDEQAEIALAAVLHDVGKIGVPDEILTKPGRLTTDEYHRLMEHTVIGERILTPWFQRRATVLAVVRSHHERFDGRGYPDGLVGHAIPLAARIVAVADAFDAMTSTRPYHPAFSVAVAVSELHRHAGTQFDPMCVRALLTVLAAARRRFTAWNCSRSWRGSVRRQPQRRWLASRPGGVPSCCRRVRGSLRLVNRPTRRFAIAAPGAPYLKHATRVAGSRLGDRGGGGARAGPGDAGRRSRRFSAHQDLVGQYRWGGVGRHDRAGPAVSHLAGYRGR